MITLVLGLGVPIGLLSVLFYLMGGHSIYELSDNGVLSFYRKNRMELLGETNQEINESFKKFHRGKSIGEYRPFTDKLVVFTITLVLGFVCYEIGYKQGNLWVIGGIGIIGWIFTGYGLLDDGWMRMQGFTVGYPYKHFSVRIPALDQKKSWDRVKGYRYCLVFILVFTGLFILLDHLNQIGY